MYQVSSLARVTSSEKYDEVTHTQKWVETFHSHFNGCGNSPLACPNLAACPIFRNITKNTLQCNVLVIREKMDTCRTVFLLWASFLAITLFLPTASRKRRFASWIIIQSKIQGTPNILLLHGPWHGGWLFVDLYKLELYLKKGPPFHPPSYFILSLKGIICRAPPFLAMPGFWVHMVRQPTPYLIS